MPNIISLDLREGDRRWDALISGNPHAYTVRSSFPWSLMGEAWCLLLSAPPPQVHGQSFTAADRVLGACMGVGC